MIKKGWNYYTDSFRGFRTEVWWLAAITLINRAGTMVVPFMSLYLTDDVGLSLEQVGWVMTAFGSGSVLGSWLGGKLSDRIGFYPVMWLSLALSGVLFILLQFLHTFESFCLGIFLLMIVSDSFRPALFVALRTYSKPENRTRAVTLIRLAINLGFSLGPAAGGVLIAFAGYSGLFWVDGITCIIAAMLFLWKLDKRQSDRQVTDQVNKSNLSPYRDGPYLLLVLTLVLVGVAFLQYFSTVPLYYRDVHQLSESSIGLLLGMNGLVIFLIEMPLIKMAEQSRISTFAILSLSAVLLSLSFLALNLSGWIGVTVIGMLLMTFGEMLNFPFLNKLAMDRADRGRPGDYMALYTIGWSLSHIIGHNTGLQLIDRYGFESTWYVMAALLLMAAVSFMLLKRPLRHRPAPAVEKTSA